MFSLSRQPEKTRESDGVPWRALAGSLALHALAFGMCAGLPLAEPAGVPPAAPLHAELRTPRETVPGAAVPAPPAAPARLHRAAANVPAPAVADAVPPAPSLAASPAVPYESAGGVAVPRAVPEPVTVAVAAPSARAPDAAGLRQYRLALAGEARRYRSFPEQARRAGMAGTAEVRVSVAAGALRQTELARSSGHAILDAAALEMLRAAAARTVLPESLRGQEFAVLMPVVFEVED